MPIETPHIERMEVLTGKGAGSDEVLRQIFDVTNKGGTPGELALRFDLTVPLARFVAKHINELGVPFKRYAIGSVFRGERPAKGRFREFVQCDFDIVGTESPRRRRRDRRRSSTPRSRRRGVPAFTITLNDRKILDGLLDQPGRRPTRRGPVLRVLDKLAKIGRERCSSSSSCSKGPTRADAGLSRGPGPSGCSTSPRPGAAASRSWRRPRSALGRQPARRPRGSPTSAPSSTCSTRPACRRSGSRSTWAWRGLDYYTGVVFETTVNGWEKFGSIASGGRYDNLASLFTAAAAAGRRGLDRPGPAARPDGRGRLAQGRRRRPRRSWWRTSRAPTRRSRSSLAARLRAAGIGAEVFPDPIQIGKQMGYGSTRGHRLAVIVGPDEHARQVFNLRNLATRQEDKGLPWSVLEDSVRARCEIVEQEGAGS